VSLDDDKVNVINEDETIFSHTMSKDGTVSADQLKRDSEKAKKAGMEKIHMKFISRKEVEGKLKYVLR
jgi:hypothetical protein